MSYPWNDNSDEYDHDTYEKNGIFKCRDCGKMATNKERLQRTPCRKI